MSCLSDDAAICRRRYGIDMPDPTALLNSRGRPGAAVVVARLSVHAPVGWLRVDPTTQEVHVYSSAVEIRDRRWFATLPTIEDAVNFCHAARSLLYAAEDDANAIGDARRGYSRIMPHQEWAPYEIYEVTWHYQPATE